MPSGFVLPVLDKRAASGVEAPPPSPPVEAFDALPLSPQAQSNARAHTPLMPFSRIGHLAVPPARGPTQREAYIRLASSSMDPPLRSRRFPWSALAAALAFVLVQPLGCGDDATQCVSSQCPKGSECI